MPVIESGFHGLPRRHISCKFDLIRKTEDVHVASDVYVSDVKFVALEEIVAEIDETRGSSFGHSIVDHYQVLIEVMCQTLYEGLRCLIMRKAC